MTWIVAQLGARMHYAVPRILHSEGILEQLFTDICANKGWLRLLHLIPPPVRPFAVARLLGRVPENVPRALITAFPKLGLEYSRRLQRAKAPSDATAVFLWNDSEFCRRVSASRWGNARAVFTFNNAGLEILQLARARGLITVMEQTIAPSKVEKRLLDEEQDLNPGWQEAYDDGLQAMYSDRQQAEWELADSIICGSDFVRDGIRECHGPGEKCVVVPYGLDWQIPTEQLSSQEPSQILEKRTGCRPLRVLTVGTLGLRKGAPVVYEAARALTGRAQFRWVGGSELLPEAVQRMRAHVELTGSVPRNQVHAHLAWADVFLLPSICEGSATVIYEALAYGLPVICTRNAGSVVSDSLDGFIVPVADARAIVERLGLLLTDRARIERMSTAARRSARDYTLAAYGQRLLSALAKVCERS